MILEDQVRIQAYQKLNTSRKRREKESRTSSKSITLLNKQPELVENKSKTCQIAPLVKTCQTLITYDYINPFGYKLLEQNFDSQHASTNKTVICGNDMKQF